MKDYLIGAGVLVALYLGYKMELRLNATRYQGQYTNTWPTGVQLYSGWAPLRYHRVPNRSSNGSPWTQGRGRG